MDCGVLLPLLLEASDVLHKESSLLPILRVDELVDLGLLRALGLDVVLE
jgi:hypothetical protein